MIMRFCKISTLTLAALALASCTPSVTLSMSGRWQWDNSNSQYARSLDQDKLSCSREADAIQERLNQCGTVQQQDCDSWTDTVDKAMCQYSNVTTKNMCSVGRMTIPKVEIVDGCIAAFGWKQVWTKTLP
jgi:hypothetical protein